MIFQDKSASDIFLTVSNINGISEAMVNIHQQHCWFHLFGWSQINMVWLVHPSSNLRIFFFTRKIKNKNFKVNLTRTNGIFRIRLERKLLLKIIVVHTQESLISFQTNLSAACFLSQLGLIPSFLYSRYMTIILRFAR